MRHYPDCAEVSFYATMAEHYDKWACRFNGRYLLAHDIQNELVRRSPCVKQDASPIIVDFGCGTGTDAIELLKTLPRARFFGIDSSPEMLRIAKLKAEESGVLSRCIFVCENFLSIDSAWLKERLNSHYGRSQANSVISAFALHHYDGRDKELVYHQAHSVLAMGGIFINTDLVSSALPWIARHLLEEELSDIRSISLAEGVEGRQVVAEWISHYRNANRPLPLVRDLSILGAVGFNFSEVAFRHSQVAVIAAFRGW